jgi:ABC-2 type transport system permease protein
MGSYFVSLVGLAILMLFLKFALQVDFGDNPLLVLLLAAVGNLAGISLGILIASIFRVSEGAKTGITIAVTMFLSVLSGMMGVTLKYVIDKNAPIVNLINPNNLITDGFYSLYYYNTLDRYFRDVCYLLVFVAICLIISFVSLRREKYDSI